jgi:drug/metabolite transporter (DMT)-like permease
MVLRALGTGPWHGEGWSQLITDYKSVLGVAVLIPIPYLLALYAMTLTSVSAIARARETSMMVGVLFSRFLLDEPNVATRFLGAGMIAVRVATLALG